MSVHHAVVFCFFGNQISAYLNVDRNPSSAQSFIVGPSLLVKSGWTIVLQPLLKLVSHLMNSNDIDVLFYTLLVLPVLHARHDQYGLQSFLFAFDTLCIQSPSASWHFNEFTVLQAILNPLTADPIKALHFAMMVLIKMVAYASMNLRTAAIWNSWH